MILATKRTSPERELMDQVIQNPKIQEGLDIASYHALSTNRSTRLQFFQVVAQGLLKKIPTPPGIQINLDLDGEKTLKEVFLHIECTDLSALLIVELKLKGTNATNLLDQSGVKHFYGQVAQAIQSGIQNDQLVKADPGNMNNRLSEAEKRSILSKIGDLMMEKANS
jgi:hypothetical protein